ncbi:hypothetical protein ABDJ38_14910 [Aurantiacibacter sp. DGU5]|uniref:Nucleoside phosphorylase domain-containing protein n=1 Tax=Aurantiacibacter flavus TaxID=3145232 RepID=A0ABV0D297_9SPHN
MAICATIMCSTGCSTGAATRGGQQALHRATAIVAGKDDAGVRDRLRTGTIVTTDDRNWELRHDEYALRFNQSRAVAINMESVTIATQGQRFRLPRGMLLCVSDQPLHGEIKRPGQANRFYEQPIREHIAIGIETVGQLNPARRGRHWQGS